MFTRFFALVLFIATLCINGVILSNVSAVDVPTPASANYLLTPSVHLFALGDTGSGNANQKAVAAAMAKAERDFALKSCQLHASSLTTCDNAEKLPTAIDGVLHLGDIIYPDGKAETLGQKLISDIYEQLTRHAVPIYFSIGNHDMRTEDAAQVIKFLDLPEKGYYNQRISHLVEVFAINTSIFDEAQQVWLKQKLLESTATYKIVFGHHPVYSTGSHGFDAELKVLRSKLEPILLHYDVDAYFAGHDHNYERFLHESQVSLAGKKLPYLHIVSGGGGAYLRKARCKPKTGTVMPETGHYAIKYHFIDIQVTPHLLTLKAIDTDGNVFDQVHIPKQ